MMNRPTLLSPTIFPDFALRVPPSSDPAVLL